MGQKDAYEPIMLEVSLSCDSELRQAVLDELDLDPSMATTYVGVAAHAGTVTLTGHVANFAEKHAVEVAVRRVKGVKTVAEEIEVRIPAAMRRHDEHIAAAAIERLYWNVSIPRGSVKVQVEQGWLTLTGQLDWYYQREVLEQDVRHLRGVAGVSNLTTVKSRSTESDIKESIMHALHRSWFFDPNTISVSAESGKVHLTGTVYSPHDRVVATAIAWAAPGATAVENDLAIA